MAKQDKVDDVLSTAQNNFDSEDDSYLDPSVSLAERIKQYYDSARYGLEDLGMGGCVDVENFNKLSPEARMEFYRKLAEIRDRNLGIDEEACKQDFKLTAQVVTGINIRQLLNAIASHTKTHGVPLHCMTHDYNPKRPSTVDVYDMRLGELVEKYLECWKSYDPSRGLLFTTYAQSSFQHTLRNNDRSGSTVLNVPNTDLAAFAAFEKLEKTYAGPDGELSDEVLLAMAKSQLSNPDFYTMTKVRQYRLYCRTRYTLSVEGRIGDNITSSGTSNTGALMDVVRAPIKVDTDPVTYTEYNDALEFLAKTIRRCFPLTEGMSRERLLTNARRRVVGYVSFGIQMDAGYINYGGAGNRAPRSDDDCIIAVKEFYKQNGCDESINAKVEVLVRRDRQAIIRAIRAPMGKYFERPDYQHNLLPSYIMRVIPMEDLDPLEDGETVSDSFVSSTLVNTPSEAPVFIESEKPKTLDFANGKDTDFVTDSPRRGTRGVGHVPKQQDVIVEAVPKKKRGRKKKVDPDSNTIG